MKPKDALSPVADRLPDLRDWCHQPLGQRLADAEQQALGEVLSDIFGYHLVALDPPCQLQSLDSSRILHRVVQSRGELGLKQVPAWIAHAECLPICSDSIDAFLLPHSLELARDPHQVLREVDRCLVAEGHIIVLGFNPFGWWGLRKLLFGWRGRVPWSLRFISLPRLKDWLSLLGFDTVESRYMFPRPPWQYGTAGDREHVLDRLHKPHWPLLAASYLLVARKRVATLTPIKPRWRPQRAVISGGVAETTHGRIRPHG